MALLGGIGKKTVEDLNTYVLEWLEEARAKLESVLQGNDVEIIIRVKPRQPEKQ